MIVYRCTNKINGHVYIGVTKKSLNARVSSHKSSANRGSKYAFHMALIKHGFDNFIWDIIDNPTTEEEMFLSEIKYIKEYRDAGFSLYNMTDGGETPNPMFGSKNGMFGKTHSDEVKNKLRDSIIGLSWEDRFGVEVASKLKQQLVSRLIGHKNSEETIQKMKESSYWKNNGHLIVGENNPNFGKKWDENKKNKLRGENNGMFGKGYLISGENNGMYGKSHSKEASLKMSQKQTARGNGNYRKIENMDEIIRVYKETNSVFKTAKIVGENYNKVRRELKFDGII